MTKPKGNDPLGTEASKSDALGAEVGAGDEVPKSDSPGSGPFRPSAVTSFIGTGTPTDQLAAASVSLSELSFDAAGLIPAIVQQDGSGEVLMMAWMNSESLSKTLASGETWFWSRSRATLWNKGATSGNRQQVKAIKVDCDEDCLLITVDSPGPACHTGSRSCFFRLLKGEC
jgi:phosphoribosyl-AMP cyclohydrolase/phosphoribosyl-ATP pyrophosphohydrolase/phosphoribosyl-AMP cyclohydrolase